MRYLVDTHIFIWYAKEQFKLSRDVRALFEDYENMFCVSSETLKELVLLWNKKPHIRKWWKTAKELVRSVEDEYGFKVAQMKNFHSIGHKGLTLYSTRHDIFLINPFIN